MAKFDAAAAACASLGWGYRLVGAADPIRTVNLRWLAGYRHPRHRIKAVGTALLEVFTAPLPLLAGAESVGDPIAVLPVPFHLLRRAVRFEALRSWCPVTAPESRLDSCARQPN